MTAAKRVPRDTSAPRAGQLVAPGRRCACGGTAGADGECAACRARRLSLRQTRPGPPGPVPSSVGEVLQLPGTPLPAAARGPAERRLGQDFSGVRVHADPRAAAAARALDADAFTHGRHVVFGPGMYAPSTSAGRQLLIHELVHVRQQRDVASMRSGELTVADPRGPEEAEAERISGGAGSAATIMPRPARRLIQRQATATTFALDGELESDFWRIVARLDESHYSDSDEGEVIDVLGRWAQRSVAPDGSLRSPPENYLDRLFARLTMRITRVGVMDEHTSYYSLIFNHFDRVDEVRKLRDRASGQFKKDEGLKELSAAKELADWKETAGEYWSKHATEFGAFLRDAGVPAEIQNLLGGIAGVVQGFAELLIELVEGIWTIAKAVGYLSGSVMYVLMGAAEELGLGFLQKVPFVGDLFKPSRYKDYYDETSDFLEGAKKAIENPRQILTGVKEAAEKAWAEVIEQYNRADDFNKSRIIAAGVVKVGMAVGGFIKNLPKMAQTAASMAKTVGKVALTVGRTIAKGLRGVARVGGKILRGSWDVVEEALEAGGKRLRYYFKRANGQLDEVAEAEARQWVHCSECELTPKAKGLHEQPVKGEEVFEELAEELATTPATITPNWVIGGNWRTAKKDAYRLIFGSKSLPDINRPGKVQMTLGHIVEKSTGGTHSLDNLMPQLNAVNVKLSGIYGRKPFRLTLPDGRDVPMTSINGKKIPGSLREAFDSGVFTMDEQRAISNFITQQVITPAFEKELANLIAKIPNLAELVQ